MVNELAAAAEAQIAKVRYNDESKRWKFDSRVAVHLAQHQILSDLVEHGYQGMDYSTKALHFTTGIKTDGLNVIKSNILASPYLQQYFDWCVTLFKSYISYNKSSREHTLNTSKTKTDPDGRNKGGRGVGGRDRGYGGVRGRVNGGENCRKNPSRKDKDNKLKRDSNGENYDISEVSHRYHTSSKYNHLSQKHKDQLRDYRDKEEEKRTNQMKATMIHIPLLGSKLDEKDGSSKVGGKSKSKSNSKNKSLNGVRRRTSIFEDSKSE